MTAMLLCAALTADFEFEAVTYRLPKYRAAISAIDTATQEAISRAPREIESMRQLAADERGDFRRKSLSRIRLYDSRLAELKAGTRVVYPRLPSRLKIGDAGTLPGPMIVVRQVADRYCLVEADWSIPARNLIDLPVTTTSGGGSGKIPFLFQLGPFRNNAKPFSPGYEIRLTEQMFRVIGEKDGLPVIEFASLEESLMLEMVAEYRRDRAKEKAATSAGKSMPMFAN